MDNLENDPNQELNQDKTDYIHDIDTSNPFSNAMKKVSELLQKMKLIKPGQLLLGDNTTNTKGYQTTSKDPLEATDKKSLRARLITAFENHQKKRADKINAKSSPNRLKVQTISQSTKQQLDQTVTPEQLQAIIHHKTPAQIAVERLKNDQQSQPRTLIDNSRKPQELTNSEEILDVPDSAEIELDESFDLPKKGTQEAAQSPLKTENLTVENTQQKIYIPQPKKTTPRTTDTKTEPEDRTM